MHPSRVATRCAISCVASWALLALAAPVAAQAENVDACGLITQHETARAFGLNQANNHWRVIQAPGNSAGVVRVRCLATIWAGDAARPPRSTAKRRQALRGGTMATLRIETRAADSGPNAAVWLTNFPSKVKGLTSRARERFVGGPLGGRAFAPPKYGGDHALGFDGRTRQLRKVSIFWWSDTGGIVSINAVQARGQRTVASVRRIAGTVVAGFFN